MDNADEDSHAQYDYPSHNFVTQPITKNEKESSWRNGGLYKKLSYL